MISENMYRKNIKPGIIVDIVLKQDQGTARLVRGRVKRVLTNKPYHSRVIKVELYDGKIGRVQKIINGVTNKEVLVESVCTSSQGGGC